jgi:hypothetical protein
MSDDSGFCSPLRPTDSTPSKSVTYRIPIAALADGPNILRLDPKWIVEDEDDGESIA